MIDEITTNPNRGEALVRKDGTPTKQMIEWFDDIELKLNEIIEVLNALTEE